MEIPFALKINGKLLACDELREHVDYEVVFLRELNRHEKEELIHNYGSVLSLVYKTYVLNFRNYVGKVQFLGRTLTVISRKWSSEQVKRMWLEVSEQAVALLYSHFSVVKQAAQRSHKEREVMKFQQWVFLRDQLLYRDELISTWELISREPHTWVRQDRVRSESWTARDVEVPAWNRAFETENVEMLRVGHPLAKTAAAQFGRPALPTHVEEVRKRKTFDTKENRFLKYMLEEMMQLVEWKEKFVLREKKKKVFGIALLLQENREMKRKLQELLSVPWFAEVGRFVGDYGNSTVLQRREGYRQWFSIYQEWLQGIRFPFDQEDLHVLVETRDIARIYEYWCFFKILQAVEKVTGCSRQQVELRRNGEYGTHLGNKTEVIYPIGVQRLSVFYNKTFSRKNGGSSSLTVRPDISLHWGGEWYHFDAKFKDGYVRRDFTLREDVERMHLYKDAIHNSRASIALYPARKRARDRFYQSGENRGGVGVIGLQLEKDNKRLERFIEQILKGDDFCADTST
ncbi:DUF2357 domain-containing protein [Tumebacillus permanentifrigoris]|uniref:Putative component of viral defense system (DUF524 family) n=1 Tax=Tumebacillus permanentifrigoris TaxID=378543 RepID=A0A316DBM9_9BACL|nr:DUF2357 domain-containing protein [Tumebacillus permanentifrigoris]PWK14400.1 putative component of viral defense system (DUF524 family) [Tumebacillus permanentifrigoris]